MIGKFFYTVWILLIGILLGFGLHDEIEDFFPFLSNGGVVQTVQPTATFSPVAQQLEETAVPTATPTASAVVPTNEPEPTRTVAPTATMPPADEIIRDLVVVIGPVERPGEKARRQVRLTLNPNIEYYPFLEEDGTELEMKLTYPHLDGLLSLGGTAAEQLSETTIAWKSNATGVIIFYTADFVLEDDFIEGTFIAEAILTDANGTVLSSKTTEFFFQPSP